MKRRVNEFIKAITFAIVLLLGAIVFQASVILNFKADWEYQLELIDQNTIKLKDLDTDSIYYCHPDSLAITLENINL